MSCGGFAALCAVRCALYWLCSLVRCTGGYQERLHSILFSLFRVLPPFSFFASIAFLRCPLRLFPTMPPLHR